MGRLNTKRVVTNDNFVELCLSYGLGKRKDLKEIMNLFGSFIEEALSSDLEIRIKNVGVFKLRESRFKGDKDSPTYLTPSFKISDGLLRAVRTQIKK